MKLAFFVELSVMSHNPIRSAEHWLQRARDAWNHVEHMQDLDARLQMIEIAESYERMAQRARERQERGENLLFPRLKLREPEGQASIA